MTEVSDYIDNYPIKRFLALSAKDQNQKLYDKFPNKQQTALRQQKCRYLKSKIVTDVTHTVTKPTDDPQSSHRSSPQTQPVGQDAGTLPPFIQQVMSIQSVFAGCALQCSVKDAVFLKQESDKLAHVADIPRYKRPLTLNPKQHEIIDAIVGDQYNIIFVEGVQRGGKSTSIMLGIEEYTLKYPTIKQQYDLMCGKGDQARMILRNLMNDQIIFEQNQTMVRTITNDYLMFWNGSRLDSHETTVADVKGGDSVISWVDEFDVAIKRDPEAVATLFFMQRAVEHMKIIMSANMDTGAYMMFRNLMAEREITNARVKFISILEADAPHLARVENDELLSEIASTLVGKGLVERRLKNMATSDGDQFDQQDIKDAYDIYETLFNTTFRTDTPWLETDFNIISIDPSNTGHPFGWISAGVVSNYIIEFDSGEFQMGLSPTGDRWSPDKVNMFFYAMAKKIHAKAVVLENNTYGGALGIYLESKGIKVYWVNHGRDGTANALSNFLSVARAVFANHAIALKNLEARPELTLYDPIERGKSNAQFKGDLADAIVNLIWVCTNGMNYLKTETLKCTITGGRVR